MPHVLPTPLFYKNKSFVNSSGNAECVEFIKQTLNAPATALWREGLKILKLKPGQADPVKPGTATFKGPAYLLAQWRDKCVREVIYPKSMRTAEFVFPAWIKK